MYACLFSRLFCETGCKGSPKSRADLVDASRVLKSHHPDQMQAHISPHIFTKHKACTAERSCPPSEPFAGPSRGRSRAIPSRCACVCCSLLKAAVQTSRLMPHRPWNKLLRHREHLACSSAGISAGSWLRCASGMCPSERCFSRRAGEGHAGSPFV